jgi:hypothetical protein
MRVCPVRAVVPPHELPDDAMTTRRGLVAFALLIVTGALGWVTVGRARRRVTATLSLDVRRRAARKFGEQSGTGRPTEFPTAGSLAYELDRTTRNPPHLKLLDQALLDADRGGCKRLIVSMPPQEGKSERLSHYGVLWWLRRHPDHRVVIASNTKELADGWGRAIRNDIVQNPWLGLTVRQDSRAAGRWQLVGRKGGVYSAGIEGSITGKPADFMVIDDPIKNRKQADSEDFRKACWNFWTDVARTRLHPHSVVIVILTRWHEDDLAGRLVENGPDQWRVINLPAVAEDDDLLGRTPGEPLQSAAGRDLAEYEQIRRDVGARTWQALYQGRPSPAEGGMFKRGWWSYYPASPAYELPSGEMWVDGPVQLVQSWDMAFKDTAKSDYVVGQVWALEGARAFLLDQVHDRMDFVATCQALRALSAKWPQAHAKLVEDKANGPGCHLDAAPAGAGPDPGRAGRVKGSAGVRGDAVRGGRQRVAATTGERAVGARLRRGAGRLPEREQRRPGRRGVAGAEAAADRRRRRRARRAHRTRPRRPGPRRRRDRWQRRLRRRTHELLAGG